MDLVKSTVGLTTSNGRSTITSSHQATVTASNAIALAKRLFDAAGIGFERSGWDHTVVAVYTKQIENLQMVPGNEDTLEAAMLAPSQGRHLVGDISTVQTNCYSIWTKSGLPTRKLALLMASLSCIFDEEIVTEMLLGCCDAFVRNQLVLAESSELLRMCKGMQSSNYNKEALKEKFLDICHQVRIIFGRPTIDTKPVPKSTVGSIIGGLDRIMRDSKNDSRILLIFSKYSIAAIVYLLEVGIGLQRDAPGSWGSQKSAITYNDGKIKIANHTGLGMASVKILSNGKVESEMTQTREPPRGTVRLDAVRHYLKLSEGPQPSRPLLSAVCAIIIRNAFLLFDSIIENTKCGYVHPEQDSEAFMVVKRDSTGAALSLAQTLRNEGSYAAVMTKLARYWTPLKMKASTGSFPTQLPQNLRNWFRQEELGWIKDGCSCADCRGSGPRSISKCRLDQSIDDIIAMTSVMLASIFIDTGDTLQVADMAMLGGSYWLDLNDHVRQLTRLPDEQGPGDRMRHGSFRHKITSSFLNLYMLKVGAVTLLSGQDAVDLAVHDESYVYARQLGGYALVHTWLGRPLSSVTMLDEIEVYDGQLRFAGTSVNSVEALLEIDEKPTGRIPLEPSTDGLFAWDALPGASWKVLGDVENNVLYALIMVEKTATEFTILNLGDISRAKLCARYCGQCHAPHRQSTARSYRWWIPLNEIDIPSNEIMVAAVHANAAGQLASFVNAARSQDKEAWMQSLPPGVTAVDLEDDTKKDALAVYGQGQACLPCAVGMLPQASAVLVSGNASTYANVPLPEQSW